MCSAFTIANFVCNDSSSEKKFKELGLCNFASWEVVDIYHMCKDNGWVLPSVYQAMYNPVARYALWVD